MTTLLAKVAAIRATTIINSQLESIIDSIGLVATDWWPRASVNPYTLEKYCKNVLWGIA